MCHDDLLFLRGWGWGLSQVLKKCCHVCIIQREDICMDNTHTHGVCKQNSEGRRLMSSQA